MLRKIVFKPGVNKENTRYTNENGWYLSDKVRFRQGTPEKIGGWVRISSATFLGVCRALWNWVTLGFENLMGLGTNLKYYIEQGGAYYDITPIRSTVTLGTDPFTGDGTTTVLVTQNNHGAVNNDFVTFSGVTGTYASLLNAEFQITYLTSNTYSITTSSVVAAGATGGSAVVAAYQINTGPEYQAPLVGWGAGPWGIGPSGQGTGSLDALRIWSAANFGQNLIFGPRGGGLYYWDAATSLTTRGVNVNQLGGVVTFTIASPCVATFSVLLTEGTAVKFSTTGALPTGLTANTTYYLRNVSPQSVEANLSATPAGAIINTSGTQSGVHSVSELVDVPTKQNYILVSDTSRFVLVFGTTPVGSSVRDPMLIRWSNAESVVDWYPSALGLNQAGELRLSTDQK